MSSAAHRVLTGTIAERIYHLKKYCVLLSRVLFLSFTDRHLPESLLKALYISGLYGSTFRMALTLVMRCILLIKIFRSHLLHWALLLPRAIMAFGKMIFFIQPTHQNLSACRVSTNGDRISTEGRFWQTGNCSLRRYRIYPYWQN